MIRHHGQRMSPTRYRGVGVRLDRAVREPAHVPPGVGARAVGRIVPVTYWCERNVVQVAMTDVHKGLTGPCSRPKCQATDAEKRAQL